MAITSYFPKIIEKLKQLGIAESVTWKKRIVTDVFDPTTQEPSVTWGDDTAIDALIRRVSVAEIFGDLKETDEIVRIYTASAIKHQDRIARAGGETYEILPVEDKTEAGYYTAFMRRLEVQ